MKESAQKKVLRSTWVVHVEKIGNGKLAKGTDAQKVETKITTIAIDDCIKSDLERVEEEWITRATYRRN